MSTLMVINHFHRHFLLRFQGFILRLSSNANKSRHTYKNSSLESNNKAIQDLTFFTWSQISLNIYVHDYMNTCVYVLCIWSKKGHVDEKKINDFQLLLYWIWWLEYVRKFFYYDTHLRAFERESSREWDFCNHHGWLLGNA